MRTDVPLDSGLEGRFSDQNRRILTRYWHAVA